MKGMTRFAWAEEKNPVFKSLDRVIGNYKIGTSQLRKVILNTVLAKQLHSRPITAIRIREHLWVPRRSTQNMHFIQHQPTGLNPRLCAVNVLSKLSVN